MRGAVEERSWCSEGHTVRWAGAPRSENVGMSNELADEKSAHQISKVSWATVIVPGLVGPKLRPL